MTLSELIALTVNFGGLIALMVAFGRARVHLYELSTENKLAIERNKTTADATKAQTEQNAVKAAAIVNQQFLQLYEDFEFQKKNLSALTDENTQLKAAIVEVKADAAKREARDADVISGLTANVALLTGQVGAAMRETAVQAEQIKTLQQAALSNSAINDSQLKLIDTQAKTLDALALTNKYLNDLAGKAIESRTQSSAPSTVDAQIVADKTAIQGNVSSVDNPESQT